MQTQTRKKAEKYGIVEAGTIIGETVVNRQDENLGEIHEIMLDAGEGRIAYAVLSSGGFLGMGKRLFAMPWDALEFSNTEQKLIPDVDREKLKAASPASTRKRSGRTSPTGAGGKRATTTTAWSPTGRHRAGFTPGPVLMSGCGPFRLGRAGPRRR